MRASTISTSLSIPYASATLLVNGTINQRKEAPVVNGAVTLTFTGVPDSGNAELYLDLLGCSYNGASSFYGAIALTSGNNVVTLSPRIIPGSNKTSDGKLLVLIPSEEDRGRITFDDSGNPIGFQHSGDIKNHITGEVYGNVYQIMKTYPKLGWTDVAWFNGKVYLGGQETLTEMDPVTKAIKVYGDPDVAQLTQDGATLDNVKFTALRDMQAVGDTLYMSSGNFTQLLKLKEGVFAASTLPVIGDGLSTLDDGKVFFMTRWDSNASSIFRVDGSSIVESVLIPAEYDDAATTVISYGNGYLIAGGKAVYYYDGAKVTKWLTPESLGSSNAVSFYIYKNAQGVIYVCSEVANKVWRVE